MPLSNPQFELSDRTQLDTRHGQLVLANIKNIDFPFISGSFYLVSNDSTFQSISLSRFCWNRSFFLCFIAQNLCLVQILPLYKRTEHFTWLYLWYYNLGGVLGRTPGASFCGLLDHNLLWSQKVHINIFLMRGQTIFWAHQKLVIE